MQCCSAPNSLATPARGHSTPRKPIPDYHIIDELSSVASGSPLRPLRLHHIERSTVLCCSSCRMSHCGRDQFNSVSLAIEEPTAQVRRKSDSSALRRWPHDLIQRCAIAVPLSAGTYRVEVRVFEAVPDICEQLSARSTTSRAAQRRRVRVRRAIVRLPRSPNA